MNLDELDALLDAARLPEAAVTVCLRGDLQVEWERLDRELAELQSTSKQTLAGANEETAKLATKIRGLEEQMGAASISVRLRALPRPDWVSLVTAHPPREDQPTDRIAQFNQATFYDDLIKRSIVDPEMGSMRLRKFLDALTEAQFDKIATAAWNLNRKDVDVPFSSAASRTTESSGTASKRQSSSGSRTGGSSAGSRKK